MCDHKTCKLGKVVAILRLLTDSAEDAIVLATVASESLLPRAAKDAKLETPQDMAAFFVRIAKKTKEFTIAAANELEHVDEAHNEETILATLTKNKSDDDIEVGYIHVPEGSPQH